MLLIFLVLSILGKKYIFIVLSCIVLTPSVAEQIHMFIVHLYFFLCDYLF